MPSIFMNDAIFCPICEAKMGRREVMVGKKRATVYFCRPCGIGTYDFDPAFNKWRDVDKSIPCPTCGVAVKWFARYLDGYFQAKCPSCGTGMKKDGDVQFGKGGNIIIPEDMEDDNEPAVNISIPVDKLKRLGKDRQNELKAKLTRRKEG